jgi:hypothetical protein
MLVLPTIIWVLVLRLAHLYKRGVGGPTNCKETVKLFKHVAERGPWMDALAAAHKHYAAGNEMAALNLFAQLAAVGVESAQYNAAYILSRCTRCPPINKAAVQGVVGAPGSLARVGGITTAAEPNTGMDSLEKKHRSLKRSTATDFRGLLKLHDAHESAAAEAKAAVAADSTRPKVVTNRESSASEQALSQRDAQALRSAAYLPAAVWREFLAQYSPESLVDPLDLEFFTGSGLARVQLTPRILSLLRTCSFVHQGSFCQGGHRPRGDTHGELRSPRADAFRPECAAGQLRGLHAARGLLLLPARRAVAGGAEERGSRVLPEGCGPAPYAGYIQPGHHA